MKVVTSSSTGALALRILFAAPVSKVCYWGQLWQEENSFEGLLSQLINNARSIALALETNVNVAKQVVAQVAHDAKLCNSAEFHECAPHSLVKVFKMLLKILLVVGEVERPVRQVVDGKRIGVHQWKHYRWRLARLLVNQNAAVAITASSHLAEELAYPWIAVHQE